MARDKKSHVLRTKRANLHFPVSMVRRTMKASLGPKRRMRKNVDVALTAMLEHCVASLLKGSAERVKRGNYIHAEHLFETLKDKEGEVANVFPNVIPGLF